MRVKSTIERIETINKSSSCLLYNIIASFLVASIYTYNLERIRLLGPLSVAGIALLSWLLLFDRIKFSYREIIVILALSTYLSLNLMFTIHFYKSFRFLSYFILFLAIQIVLNNSYKWHEIFIDLTVVFSMILVVATFLQFLFPDPYFKTI